MQSREGQFNSSVTQP
nr:unnamed protein product [Callosobruchus chinensis]